ncbi:MAG: hypothetical protein AB1807_11665 [Pseudomonadota bacterium]
MNIRHFLIHSYLFWAIFSLLNFPLLWFLAVPVLPLVFVPRVFEVFPFLWTPAVAAFISSVGLLLAATMATRRWHTKWVIPVLLAYVGNGAFLLVFLALAEQEKNAAIEMRLSTRHPDCVEVHSVFESIQQAGGDFNFTAHALIKENGKTFYWSFKTMDFFEGHERLDRNFPCRPSKGWTTAAASHPPHRLD